MHVVHPTKREEKGIRFTVATGPVATGHKQHRSGSGKHGDRRTKRLKTRSAQVRNSLEG